MPPYLFLSMVSVIISLPAVPALRSIVTAKTESSLKASYAISQIFLIVVICFCLFFLGELVPHLGLIHLQELKQAEPTFADTWNAASYILAALGIAVTIFFWRATRKVSNKLKLASIVITSCYSLAIPFLMKTFLAAILDAFLL